MELFFKVYAVFGLSFAFIYVSSTLKSIRNGVPDESISEKHKADEQKFIDAMREGTDVFPEPISSIFWGIFGFIMYCICAVFWPAAALLYFGTRKFK